MSARSVLFLCTGNSARSLLAEALLNRLGAGRLRAFSAGSRPRSQIHPLTLRVLAEAGESISGLRSKSWDEFAAPGAPPLDVVITVCSSAASEACPIWQGGPVTAHWDIDDPAAVEGTEEDRLAAFLHTYAALERRIRRLADLPLESLDRATLARELERIGRDATSR